MPVHCCCIVAVSLIFNGTTITGPILIYHDEIVSDTAIPTDENSDGPGDLVCRTASIGRIFWRLPTGSNVPATGDFYNFRTPNVDPQIYPYLARLSTIDYLDSTDPTINGLWFCPLGFTGGIEDQDIIDSFIYVGIYSRNSGELYSSTEGVCGGSPPPPNPPASSPNILTISSIRDCPHLLLAALEQWPS